MTSELAVLRAGLECDAVSAHAGLAALGFFEPHDPRFEPSHVLEHVRALNAWYASDERVTLTPQYVSGLLAHAGDPRSPYWDLMRNETLPAESLLASRMQAMALATVGQLCPSANWHQIMSEWICGSPPGSPLGTAEAEFFSARLGYSRLRRKPGPQRQHPQSARGALIREVGVPRAARLIPKRWATDARWVNSL